MESRICCGAELVVRAIDPPIAAYPRPRVADHLVRSSVIMGLSAAKVVSIYAKWCLTKNNNQI